MNKKWSDGTDNLQYTVQQPEKKKNSGFDYANPYLADANKAMPSETMKKSQSRYVQLAPKYENSQDNLIEKNEMYRRKMGLDKPKTREELNKDILKLREDMILSQRKLNDFVDSSVYDRDGDLMDERRINRLRNQALTSPKGKNLKIESDKAEARYNRAMEEKNQFKTAMNLMGLTSPMYSDDDD